MPNNGTWGTVISALGGVAGTAINAASSGGTNERSAHFTEWMYDKARQHALDDYHMQNEYNSPKNQMQRYKDAGLNPNLIYGQSNEGATVRSSSGQGTSMQAPQVDPKLPGQIVQGYYDTQMKRESINNMKAQHTVMEMEAVLKDAQTRATLADAGLKETDLLTRSQSNIMDLQGKAAGINKTMADTKYTLDNNERAAIQNSQSLKESAERILKMRAERSKIPSEIEEINARIKNLEKDSKLKEMDIKMREMGIQPNDPMYARVLAKLIGNASTNIPTTTTEAISNQINMPLYWMRRKK